MGINGGQVVTLLAFFSDDSSLNPDKSYTLAAKLPLVHSTIIYDFIQFIREALKYAFSMKVFGIRVFGTVSGPVFL